MMLYPEKRESSLEAEKENLLIESARHTTPCINYNAKIYILFKTRPIFHKFLAVVKKLFKFMSYRFLLQMGFIIDPQANYRKSSSSFFAASSTLAGRERIVPRLLMMTAAGSSVTPYAAAASALPPEGLQSCGQIRASASTVA